MAERKPPIATPPVAVAPRKTRKLPARFPRAEKILLFDDMMHLDTELERVVETAHDMVEHPDLWDELAEGLDYLKNHLIEAYVEHEKFWQSAHWKPEEDVHFLRCLQDHQEMRARLEYQEIHQPRDFDGNFSEDPPYPHYDPGQLACAHCLYLILLLQQSPCNKKTIDIRLKELQLYLYRYTAASLYSCAQRQATFTPGRVRGAKGALPRLIALLILEHGLLDFESLWKYLKKESEPGKATVKYSPLVVEEVDDGSDGDEPRLYYRVGTRQKDISKRRVQNVLYEVYNKSEYPPLNYLKALCSRDPAMDFSAFWAAIQAECEQRTITAFETTQMVSADNEQLVYRYRTKEYRVSQAIIWHRFRSLKKK